MPAACVVGVDLGGTKALAGVVDDRLRVSQRARRPVTGLDQTVLLRTVVDAITELRRAASAEVTAVGVGIPCLIDQSSGRAVTSVHLPLADVAFRDLMAEWLGLPVFVDNDANVAALAEHRSGAARGFSHAIMLTVGTGIGGALLLDGHLYRGALGAAGELGHMVIDVDGPQCACGNRGCLEAVASGTALRREAERLAHMRPESALGDALAAGRELTGPFVVELAHDGDSDARASVELIGRQLGVGIANLVNIFNPEVVVIGGGVIAAGELLLGPARAEMAGRALEPSRELAQVVPAHFGEEAGMVGAAALALEGLADRGIDG